MNKIYNKSLPCFYEPTIGDQGKEFPLSYDNFRHAMQVLRMQQQDQLQITDGSGNLYDAVIVSTGKKDCIVRISGSAYFEQNTRHVKIGISLLKNTARFEWFLEKVTEIGVAEIIPLLCSRTQKQNFKTDRISSIISSAMVQSKRVWLPKLHEPQTFKTVVENIHADQKLIAHCEEDEQKGNLDQMKIENDVLLLIGPEGDFTLDEINFSKNNNYKSVSLSLNRLRTETAGIVSATLLMHL